VSPLFVLSTYARLCPPKSFVITAGCDRVPRSPAQFNLHAVRSGGFAR
jgi:hypothetical protein